MKRRNLLAGLLAGILGACSAATTGTPRPADLLTVDNTATSQTLIVHLLRHPSGISKNRLGRVLPGQRRTFAIRSLRSEIWVQIRIPSSGRAFVRPLPLARGDHFVATVPATRTTFLVHW